MRSLFVINGNCMPISPLFQDNAEFRAGRLGTGQSY
jgi:hypothetical protein